MKLLLASITLGAAAAQLTPARLRQQRGRELKGDAAAEPQPKESAKDEEMWSVESEFGQFIDLSISTSMSMSMVITDSPTPSPQTLTYPPTLNETMIPTFMPSAEGTISKSSKANKKELVAYSWDLPAEYTGYFEIYEGHPKGRSGTVEDLELIDVVELGTGTSGSASAFLQREEYTIVVVNQNQTVGYCCEGSQPGWIHFTYGGIEYDRRTKEYSEKKDRDVFIAEFHKKPHKIEVGDDGAFYEFTIRL
ncbi:hypothetical protein ACHAXN_001003 [Cyclotella atomus]|jgi:hypothetical protein